MVAGILDPTALMLMHEGYFRQAGINAHVTVFDSGVPQVPALAKGSIDMGFVAPSPLIEIASRGTPIKLVALAYANGHGIQGILTRPNSGIRSPADLKGHSVGYIAGSIQQYDLQQLLAAHGLSLKDINSVNTPVALMPAAYSKGSVDALFAAQVAYQRIQSAGARVIAEQYQIPNAPAGGVAGYIARGAYIQQNPECMRRFIHALALAIQGVKAHPATAKGLLMHDDGLTSTEANRVMREVQTPTIPTQLSTSYPLNLNHGGLAQGLSPIIAFMQSLGQLAHPITGASIVDAGPMESYANAAR